MEATGIMDLKVKNIAIKNRTGRPSMPAATRKKTTTIRLSDDERARFESLGGVKWLRKLLADVT